MSADPYARTLAWLYRLEARAGIDLKLARVERAVAALGHPERRAPTVHVAGTNGKGSTATMLAAMLGAAGRRVGLFTSPHLVEFPERIQIDGVPIAADEVVEGVAHVRATVPADLRLTCFEVMTLLAWWSFARHEVDVVVLETGLGGRLDATNVVLPVVSVITNVGHDHEAFLGRDERAIAGEKAGIIKPGVPVVSAAGGAAAEVIAARAAALASPLDVCGRDFFLSADTAGALTYRSPTRTLAPLAVPLLGAHQHRNLALALRALERAPGLMPSATTVRRALGTLTFAGRLQVVGRAPLVLLDGAHNPEGIEAAVAEVARVAAGRRVRVLFGVMRDKAWPTMLRSLGGVASEVVVTRPRQPRAADPATIAADAPGVARVDDDPVRAFRDLIATSRPDDVVLVAGSLFLIGDVLPAAEPRYATAAARERVAARLAGRP